MEPPPAESLLSKEAMEEFCTKPVKNASNIDSTYFLEINNIVNMLAIALDAAQSARKGEPLKDDAKILLPALRPGIQNFPSLYRYVWPVRVGLINLLPPIGAFDPHKTPARKIEDEMPYRPEPVFLPKFVVHKVFADAYALFDPANERGEFYLRMLQEAAEVLKLPPLDREIDPPDPKRRIGNRPAATSPVPAIVPAGR